MIAVSVLFARADSVYRGLSFDVWDEARDARRYMGPWPVVAHPPCRGWGRLSHLAKASAEERALGLLAARRVRQFGGVLEHPHASKLWAAAGLPVPGFVDEFGGFTLLVDQGWWGHPAPKPTWLYFCGVDREAVTASAWDMVTLRRAAGRTMKLDRAEREATPEALAQWLVSVAAQAVTPSQGASYTELRPPVTPTWCEGYAA